MVVMMVVMMMMMKGEPVDNVGKSID